jgi:hypothetical protein
MTMRPGHLGTICYEQESAFAEDASTLSAPIRLPITSRVDLSGLNWDRVDIPYTRAYVHESWHHVKGPMGGSFSFVVPLTGHGSTAAGAITATVIPTLLGLLIGNSDASSVGGVCDGTGTAAAPNVDGGAEAFAVGSLCRIGSIGDGRGGGQMAVVNSLTGPPGALSLRNALAAAPNDGDVVYAMEMIYPSEIAADANVTSLRVLLQTGNMQALCGGCHLQSIAFRNLNNGEIPEVEVTMGVSWIKHVALTFPFTATLQKFAPAMVGSGFMHIQDVGTTTRNLISFRDLQVTMTPRMVVDRGPEVPVEGGVIESVKLMGFATEMSFVHDPEAATATPTWFDEFARDGNSQTWKEMVATLSVGDGRAVGLHFPSLVYKAPAPFQHPDGDANRERLTFMAQTNSVQATLADLSLAAFKIGVG